MGPASPLIHLSRTHRRRELYTMCVRAHVYQPVTVPDRTVRPSRPPCKRLLSFFFPHTTLHDSDPVQQEKQGPSLTTAPNATLLALLPPRQSLFGGQLPPPTPSTHPVHIRWRAPPAHHLLAVLCHGRGGHPPPYPSAHSLELAVDASLLPKLPFTSARSQCRPGRAP